MSRAIGLTEEGLIVRYGGLDKALLLVSAVVVPRQLIESVELGLRDGPSVFTLRRVGVAIPFRNTRRGRFWRDGKRWFLDVREDANALVVRLQPGARFDVVAIETPEAEELAAHLWPGWSLPKEELQ